MAKKVSKNARLADRKANANSGRNFIKVVKSVKDEKTGKYTYQQVMIHKDEVKEFLAKK